MANTHGRAVAEQLHRIVEAHEGIHVTHRKRVAQRHALPPIILSGARTATREQLPSQTVQSVSPWGGMTTPATGGNPPMGKVTRG